MPNTVRPRDDKERSARAQEQAFKRARGAISCAECRRLKLKCDKTVPCSSCKRRGCSSICPNGSLTTGQGTRLGHLLGSRPDFSGGLSFQSGQDLRVAEQAFSRMIMGPVWACTELEFILADTDRLHRKIAEMSDRIRELEDSLALLQSSVSRETHPLLSRDRLKIKSGLELHSAASRLGGDGLFEEEEEEDEESEYIDSFGTLAVRDDGAATFYGRSAGSESLLLDEKPGPATAPPERPPNKGPMLPASLARLTTSFPSAPSDIPAEDMQELIEEHLPPWPRAAQLCDLYLEQAPWFFGAVTRRQLLEEILPLFYDEAAEGAKSGALSSSAAAFALGREGGGTGGSSHDLALLFVIFCFGALTDVDLPPAPHNPEAERYFQLTRAALNLEPVLERPPSVVTVQTLSLMAIYQGLVADENSIESTWALMGLSSKLAQSIGLHRDCARWKLSPAEVQKRRALFWEVFITDCWQALATGRLSTFSLPFVDTELPADPDETLAEDGTPQLSFPAWKARWGKECVSEVVQGTLTSRAPKYTVILELDRKLRDMPLPKYATGSPPEGKGLSETMSHYMPINYLHLTLLYVHRCFFAQALSDHPTDPLRSPYSPSFLAGYRSACILLSSLREQFNLFPIQIARFWVLWTHAFSSTVMLASVVTHGGTTKTAQAALGELRLAYDLFESAAKHGGRAVKFLPIVRRLHDKAYATYTQGLPPVRDIFAPRVDAGQHDELQIFSGRTRTVATKSHNIQRVRSVSRRRPGASSSTPSSSTSGPISPDSTTSPGSGSGSSRSSESPQVTSVDMFPALQSYGGAVHPMLVDEMHGFQGALDDQIRDVNAYYMSKQEEARLEEQRRYGDMQQSGSYPTPPDYQSPPQKYEMSQGYGSTHGYEGVEGHSGHQEYSEWYPAPPQTHGQPEHDQAMSQYPGRTSQLVPVDPQHAGFAQGHSQPYPSYHAGDSNHTTVPHGQYHGFPPAMHAPAYHSDMPPPPPATRSQLWQVPPGQTGHELGYPTTPIDYPSQPTQPVHPGNSYGHAPTPSLSRSHSMTQMRQDPSMAPQPVMNVHYSLQETWNSFVQHQLPTPVAPQPPPQGLGYGGAGA
ncbi:fungal-specific transcription factor domain-containing protein [Fomitopsis serialis]|uniref:fungal-specific transcription factor domain-containing protein n=1 Tax=Fomitopsis serialis TaxID=139415 RepID=UPI002007F9B0|nr:fungal-specific transcription factor domain-containing protein [Neoantrodia serialis]KAH9931591.1 fungal-specific transcription factor domain-containing protein [Neoantrodia serialis]